MVRVPAALALTFWGDVVAFFGVVIARAGRFGLGNTEFAPHTGTVMIGLVGSAVGLQALSRSQASSATACPSVASRAKA